MKADHDPVLFLVLRRSAMLRYAIVFFLIAIVAAVFGFGGIAGAATEIAQVLFVIFVVLFVLSLIFGRRGGTRVD
jgi:uncharacterized membrane protein YtjA (UPF0391 family)